MRTSWRWPWLEPGADAAELDELAVGVGANRIEGKVQRVGGGLPLTNVGHTCEKRLAARWSCTMRRKR